MPASSDAIELHMTSARTLLLVFYTSVGNNNYNVKPEQNLLQNLDNDSFCFMYTEQNINIHIKRRKILTEKLTCGSSFMNLNTVWFHILECAGKWYCNAMEIFIKPQSFIFCDSHAAASRGFQLFSRCDSLGYIYIYRHRSIYSCSINAVCVEKYFKCWGVKLLLWAVKE